MLLLMHRFPPIQLVYFMFSEARAKLLEGQLEQQRRALQKKEEARVPHA